MTMYAWIHVHMNGGILSASKKEDRYRGPAA